MRLLPAYRAIRRRGGLLVSDQAGTVAEYALLLAVITMLCAGTGHVIGRTLSIAYRSIGDALLDAPP